MDPCLDEARSTASARRSCQAAATRERPEDGDAAPAVGLATIGLIHLLDAPGKLSETPYLFWLYLALVVGCVGGAGLLVRAHSRLAWAAAAVLCLNPLAGYVLSRTTGLPGAMGDIGNWAEPLGLASLFVETGVLALSLYGLSLARRRDAAGGSRLIG